VTIAWPGDAEKPSNPACLERSLRFNVIRDGAVIDGASSDPKVQGVRRFFDRLAADPRVDATALQTVGSKGYDDFSRALVRAAT
jgi:predicted O-methyltransferase YrrM